MQLYLRAPEVTRVGAGRVTCLSVRVTAEGSKPDARCTFITAHNALHLTPLFRHCGDPTSERSLALSTPFATSCSLHSHARSSRTPATRREYAGDSRCAHSAEEEILLRPIQHTVLVNPVPPLGITAEETPSQQLKHASKRPVSLWGRMESLHRPHRLQMLNSTCFFIPRC